MKAFEPEDSERLLQRDEKSAVTVVMDGDELAMLRVYNPGERQWVMTCAIVLREDGIRELRAAIMPEDDL